jgi:hypothetical protein
MKVDLSIPIISPDGEPAKDPKTGREVPLSNVAKQALFVGGNDTDERGKPKRDEKSLRLARKFWKQLCKDNTLVIDQDEYKDLKEFFTKSPVLSDGQAWQIQDAMEEAHEQDNKPHAAE